MEIKILVATHKKYWMPSDTVYMPIHVGCKGKSNLGYIGDDTGDNITEKNPNYCELTAIYWGWKNISSDYIGLVHYRRYFTRQNRWSVEARKKEILQNEEWASILRTCPVIVGDKRKYYIETNRSHYNHSHHKEGLDTVEIILKEKFPTYIPAFEKVCNRRWAHMFNMFVMRRDLYDKYCEWLFTILLELELRLDISKYNQYESRVFGFVSEILLDVWLEANNIIYKEQNISFMESQNWLKKLGHFFLRKILGNK